MTLEELDAKYAEASWLIARRSAVAAGKALIFSAASLDDVAEEIAALYGLSADDAGAVRPTSAHDALAGVQAAATGLFGDSLGMSTGQAVSVAGQAVVSDRGSGVLRTLMRAGPRAAKALLAGGRATKAVGTTAGRGTPWLWIATAAYATGTAAWFAYNLRAFNLAAFELVRQRENIVLPPERLDERGLISLATFEPVLSSISAGAGVVGEQATAAWEGAVSKGEQVADATGGLLAKLAKRWRKRVPLPDAEHGGPAADLIR